MNPVSARRNTATAAIEINKVMRNTYLLLGMTLCFSALTAWFAMASNAAPLNPILAIVGIYGLLFLTQALRNSALGLVATFAFTGFMGYTLGPMLSYYIAAFSNGGQLVMTALGATGVIFFALSGYVMMTRKDFSYLSGFLFVGIIVAFVAMLASFFFAIPGLHLAVSAAFVLIASGLILFQTSAIIHGGERNYIMATITLYVSIYNLFVSLLHLFAAFSGRD
jgi:modulator of FtsH protease